jgi:mRNA-degrading endonuclease RelE of RelBE toxin-antitoxin system
MIEVEITLAASEEIKGLPKVIRARMYTLAERLRNWPNVSGVKQLSGNLAGHYRVRTGDYRLQFYVTAEALIVERVGHRDGFYEA